MVGILQEIPKEYVEDHQEKPGGEHRKWEEERLMAAVFHVGAKDAEKVCDIYVTLQVLSNLSLVWLHN